MYEVYLMLAAQRNLARANAESRASTKASDSNERVRALEERFDKLLMICQAQWALVKQATGLDEQDLLDKIREVDLSDGVLDGKVRQGVAKCHACDRAIGRRHASCIYCGEPRAGTDSYHV